MLELDGNCIFDCTTNGYFYKGNCKCNKGWKGAACD